MSGIQEKTAGIMSTLGEAVKANPEIVTIPAGVGAGAGIYSLLSLPEERATKAYLKWMLGGGLAGEGVGAAIRFANKPADVKEIVAVPEPKKSPSVVLPIAIGGTAGGLGQAGATKLWSMRKNIPPKAAIAAIWNKIPAKSGTGIGLGVGLVYGLYSLLKNKEVAPEVAG